MDPNVALAKAREAAGELLNADDDGNFTDPETTNLGQLIESFNALDEWITKGGFLPNDWQPKSDEVMCEICGHTAKTFEEIKHPGDSEDCFK